MVRRGAYNKCQQDAGAKPGDTAVAIKHVWIVVDHRFAEDKELGSYKTESGAQRKYDSLKRSYPFGKFSIRCESVAVAS